jgi:hypothetical protein
MSSFEAGSGPDSLAVRVEEIVRAAEREAEALQRELAGGTGVAAPLEQGSRAVAPATDPRDAALADERLGDLHVVVDDLVRRAESARAALVELEAAIVAARAALAAPRPAANRAPAAPEAAVAPDSGVASEPDVVGARLVAMEMAFAGLPRTEVAQHLREHFRIDDTEGMLDDVFGPGRETWRG